jgi:dTDP-4-amino-4,6-dideoxygalactose transaminase
MPLVLGNGTDALTLSLWASGIKDGDKVIAPAFTAPATAVAIIRAGAMPVFVDVDEKYLTIDLAQIEIAASKGAKAVVPVHLYGTPCEMGDLLNIAEKFSLTIIEDCAQSFGSKIEDVHCGNFSKAAAFSFYPTKNLGAYGDGGAVLTNEQRVKEKLKMMRFYGQDQEGECVRQGDQFATG